MSNLGRRLAAPQTQQTLTLLGMTAVFVGYFAVWLPGPAAGLRLIGLEIGEWIKFLGIGARRDLFYLPPITLGICMALLTASWPNDRWQTWAMRALAVGVGLLAFPAVAAITGEPRSEWLVRLVLIGLVASAALLSSLASAGGWSQRGIAWLIAIVALAGAVLPTWQYLASVGVVRQALRMPVGVGLGVWLNLAGHLLIAAIAFSSAAGILTKPEAGR